MLEELEPNVFVTGSCNQKCIFCSAVNEDREMTPREIARLLKKPFENLSMEGGEPLLDGELEKKALAAKKAGAKNIIVLTNGSLLSEKRTRSLLNAGVTTFNFNLPSCRGKLHDLLTGTKNKFKSKIEIIKKTIKTAPANSVVLTFVVNSLNYREIPEYVEFAEKKLKGFFYVSLNLVKIKGRVKKNLKLVPKISRVRPYLKKAFHFAARKGIYIVSDGFPLCAMKGFEYYSIDMYKALHGDSLYAEEKAKAGICGKCSLCRICFGPRADYLALYGCRELNPFKMDMFRFLSAYYEKSRKKSK